MTCSATSTGMTQIMRADRFSKFPKWSAVMNAIKNTMRNSDKQEARTKSDRALQKSILSILTDNMELFKQYTDNPDFRKRLSDLIFNLTYHKDEKTDK